MWDDHVTLNRISRLILVATVLFTAWVGGRAMLEKAFPFRQVTVQGALHAETAAGVRYLAPQLSGGFFSMDLKAVRNGLMQLPWVRQADVHRLWPGRLVISIEEHKPAASWNDRASLNEYGEVFAIEPAAGLPRIYAPDGMEKLVFRRHGEFTRMVAPLGLHIEQLVVTARQSWRVRLSGGIAVELGRERLDERLGRFVAAYPRTVASIGPIQRADMRYPNGFATQSVAGGRPAAASPVSPVKAGKA